MHMTHIWTRFACMASYRTASALSESRTRIWLLCLWVVCVLSCGVKFNSAKCFSSDAGGFAKWPGSRHQALTNLWFCSFRLRLWRHSQTNFCCLTRGQSGSRRLPEQTENAALRWPLALLLLLLLLLFYLSLLSLATWVDFAGACPDKHQRLTAPCDVM